MMSNILDQFCRAVQYAQFVLQCCVSQAMQLRRAGTYYK